MYGAACTASTWITTPRWARMMAHQVGHRLNGADLVVGEHQRDEDRPVVDRGLELLGVDTAVAVDGQRHDLEAELLEVPQRVEHGVMLDGAGDESVAARLAGPGDALERKVDRLGATRREDDLARLGVERGRYPLMCLVQRRAGTATGPVDGRRDCRSPR